MLQKLYHTTGKQEEGGDAVKEYSSIETGIGTS